MKTLVAALLVSMSVSQAFADGVLYCSGVNQETQKTEDVLVIEPDMAVVLSEKGDQRFLSPQWERGEIVSFSNSKVLVTLNYKDKTITTTQRADGSSKVHTNFKCTYPGDEMD